jgi:hypothetical protein
MNRLALTVIAFAVGLSAPHTVVAQAPEQPEVPQALSVFMDCNARNCDSDHFRREITWVNWMRDRQDGDLHLLITSQQTGGGGTRYTLDYLGRGPLEGVEKSLSYVSDADDTDSEVREGLTRTIALGLVQFVETTPVAPRLRVVYAPTETSVIRRDERDPWNLWVFRVGADGSIEGDSLERGYSLESSASADRVSEDMKINVRVSGDYNRDEFDDLEEGEKYVNTSEDYSASVLTVWSLTDRWSLGGRADASRSTFLNNDLTVSGGPTVEYNIFPYRESTRRSITFRYSIEVAAFNYGQVTVEGKLNEVLPRHSLMIAAALQQPWGEIFGSVEGIQYFHDLATHRINTNLDVEYRLFRGLSLDVSGRFSRIKDQFYLGAEDLTPEEILLRRLERETPYRFEIGIGFSYRFGSKFANIVNPRMSDRHWH